MPLKNNISLSEIRLFEDKGQSLHVACPQSLLVRLLHFLGSKGFQCGVARISSHDNRNRTQSIVSFGIESGTHEEIKYAIRVFLSVAKVKFDESSDSQETVFSIVNKGLRK